MPLGFALFDFINVDLVCDKILTSHISWLFQAHDMKDRRSYVGQTTILHCCRIVVCNIDEWYWVE